MEITREDLERSLLEILLAGGVFPSKSEGRRNMQQGGVSIDDVKITDIDHKLKEEDFTENYLLVKKGKKKIYRILITE